MINLLFSTTFNTLFAYPFPHHTKNLSHQIFNKNLNVPCNQYLQNNCFVQLCCCIEEYLTKEETIIKEQTKSTRFVCVLEEFPRSRRSPTIKLSNRVETSRCKYFFWKDERLADDDKFRTSFCWPGTLPWNSFSTSQSEANYPGKINQDFKCGMITISKWSRKALF